MFSYQETIVRLVFTRNSTVNRDGNRDESFRSSTIIYYGGHITRSISIGILSEKILCGGLGGGRQQETIHEDRNPLSTSVTRSKG